MSPFAIHVSRDGSVRSGADGGGTLLQLLVSIIPFVCLGVSTFLTPTRLASEGPGVDLSLEGALWRRFLEKMRSARASFFFRSRPVKECQRRKGNLGDGRGLPSWMIFSKSVATFFAMIKNSRDMRQEEFRTVMLDDS